MGGVHFLLNGFSSATKNFQTNIEQALNSKGLGAAYLAGVVNNLFFYGAEIKTPHPAFRNFCAIGAIGTLVAQGMGLLEYADSKAPPSKESSKYLANMVLNLALSVTSSAVGMPSLKLLSFLPLFLVSAENKGKK